jgi:hypothetical protein
MISIFQEIPKKKHTEPDLFCGGKIPKGPRVVPKRHRGDPPPRRRLAPQSGPRRRRCRRPLPRWRRARLPKVAQEGSHEVIPASLSEWLGQRRPARRRAKAGAAAPGGGGAPFVAGEAVAAGQRPAWVGHDRSGLTQIWRWPWPARRRRVLARFGLCVGGR